MNTSPRISSSSGTPRRELQRQPRTVRRLWVTSSPIRPLPRVEPTAKRAALVAQAHGDAVVLGLRGVGERLGCAEVAAHARVEGLELLGAHRVVEREHGQRVLDRSEAPAGSPPTRWVGESGSSTRVGRLQRLSSRNSRSYSASEISGLSSTW